MVQQRSSLSLLHRLLAALDGWRSDPGMRRDVADALTAVAYAYAVRGVRVVIGSPSLPQLEIETGSLIGHGAGGRSELGLLSRDVAVEGAGLGEVRILIDGDDEEADSLASALELSLDAVTSRHQARLQRQQLEALDAAVRGIAAVRSVDAVLQLIVDRVRELVAAEYAALGIVGPFGSIEQFVTSGLSREQRETIGELPRGHGLLGLIIREDRSFLIDDMATDDRRYGFPPGHPEMHSFLGVPVRSKGQSIGNLYLTNKLTSAAFSEADLRLVDMFALHAGIAMQNARLHAEVQRLAVTAERQRISQDLHDSIIQTLYATSLSLEDLPDVTAEDRAEGAARVDRAIDSINATIRDIRNFIMGLQPESLEGSDLAAVIEGLAVEFRINTLIGLEVDISALPTITATQAAHALAITHEGLSNIARHSSASRAWLELSAQDGMLQIVIRDNGRGFDTANARRGSQRGLANLRSRAEAARGSLRVTSQSNEGTRLEAKIGVEEEG